MRLLLIEDDDDQVERMRRALSGQDTVDHLVRAADGVEGLERLRSAVAHAEPLPDLVLLDLNLPRRGGLDVLREIKEDPELRRIPVVVLSSSRSPEDMNEAYRRHANSFVVKPVEYQSFERMVRLLSSYWADLNRSPGIEPTHA